jgi:signal transduction histidine kinase
LQARGNLLVSLLAAGLVAVLFAPLRERLQRGVNRLMYGERDDPYAVLSRLGQRLEATLEPSAVLQTIVETVAQALKLPYVAVALQQDGELVTAAEYGTSVGEPTIMPLVYQKETVGGMILSPRTPKEPFSPADRHLLEDLARHAEVAVHAVRLTADLQRSRERLVTTREEERRRLRRDLHDGLGPQLATQTLKLDAARNLLMHEPKAADALLGELKAETQAAIADIRRLVYALRPPALDELGLVSAIHEQATNYGLPQRPEGETDHANTVVFSLEAPDQAPPLPAAVEVAAYRIAQEAITNVARHARARTCRIRISLGKELQLEIIDDGVGLPLDRHAGVGLTSMRERAAELGGSCVIEPMPTGGTRVLVRLPLPPSEE